MPIVEDLTDCRVLIVDDARANVDMLVEALRGDYKLSVALDGEAALRAIERSAPDLLLLDIMMPGIDGWETLTRLKRDNDTTGIPVIIFTAREHTRGHQKSSEMGAADYFRKPFEPDELIELVEKHIAQTA